MNFIPIMLAGLLGSLWPDPQTRLEEIRAKGALRVVTRIHPTTYFEGPNGPAGFELALAKRFARSLKLPLSLLPVKTPGEVVKALQQGRADLAAGGIARLHAYPQQVRYGPDYMHVVQQLAYRRGNKRPKSLADTRGGSLEVPFHSGHAQALRKAQARQVAVYWSETGQQDSSKLLKRVWEKELDYTVAYSHEIAVARRYHPELGIGFDLGGPLPVAWMLPTDGDDSLYFAVARFFDRLRSSGELRLLEEQYFGYIDGFDYVGARQLLADIDKRLPRYRQNFVAAANLYDLDWHLLAAVGYQESHWKPDAISPTGVRGLMMLTRATAAQMGVTDRLDPAQSILGGARYLRRMLDRIPARIQAPDRIWFALAAYNVGYGHLEDARVITERQGFNPDLWIDVKRHLPLLSKKRWYQNTRHGYARGGEPVRYVENIRLYSDTLLGLPEDTAEKAQPG